MPVFRASIISTYCIFVTRFAKSFISYLAWRVIRKVSFLLISPVTHENLKHWFHGVFRLTKKFSVCIIFPWFYRFLERVFNRFELLTSHRVLINNDLFLLITLFEVLAFDTACGVIRNARSSNQEYRPKYFPEIFVERIA